MVDRAEVNIGSINAHADVLVAQRRADPRHLAQTVSRIYSRNFEDAYVAEIFARIGETSRLFVEFGAGHGINCNTRLLLEAGWMGLWVCAEPAETEAVRQHLAAYIDAGRLRVATGGTTVNTINAVVEEHLGLFDVDLLSLNDCYSDPQIWRALRLKARATCIAYDASMPPSIAWEASDGPASGTEKRHSGGSLKLLEQIGRTKELSLVGCELHGRAAFLVADGDVEDRFLQPFTSEVHYEPLRSDLGGPAAPLPSGAVALTTAARENSDTLGRVIRLPGLPAYVFHTHDKAVDQYIAAQIGQRGTWEVLETEIVRRLLGCYPTFLDLGANVGWYTCLAKAAMAPGSAIFAFEPEPRNFALLQKNVGEKGDNIHLLQMAISDTTGSISLHLSDTNQGDHRIYASEQGRSAISVPMMTLDSFLDGRVIGPCLLKSDTQGSEPKILRGARKTLAPIIEQTSLILEFWPHGMSAAGEDISAFISFLSGLPHHALIIDNDSFTLTPITLEALARRSETDLAPDTGFFVDLLLVPPNSPAYTAIADLITAPA